MYECDSDRHVSALHQGPFEQDFTSTEVLTSMSDHGVESHEQALPSIRMKCNELLYVTKDF